MAPFVVTANPRAFGRVAVVHDYLSQFGGAERVALALSDIFAAPIFTSFYAPGSTFEGFRTKTVHTSWLQHVVPPHRFRYFAPLIGPALQRLDLSAFDTVVVSTSGFAHHIEHDNAFVYCHTPPRFIYDLDHYFSKPLAAAAVKPVLPWLRSRDQAAAARHPRYAANSAKVAHLIAELYDKQAPVVHPPVPVDHLPPVLTALPRTPRALMVTRLQPYKRVDLGIEACARAGIPLTVVGSGISEHQLRAKARGDVTFLGRVPDAELAELFRTHSVVLTPGVEDFGFAPVEANYAGRPVVARGGGGALETVQENVTGHLVFDDDPQLWADILTTTLDQPWDPELLRKSTLPFQYDAFREQLLEWMAAD